SACGTVSVREGAGEIQIKTKAIQAQHCSVLGSAYTMDAYKLAEIAVFRGACQKLRELRPVVALLQRRRLHTVIEIGTLKGGTLWLWCQLARPDAVLISVDLPGGEFGGGYPVKDRARLRSYAQGDQSLHLLRSDSHTKATWEAVAQKLDGRKVDLLF